ncbi:unnamed protein product [Dracunculus medinensis]|uniref:Uncharacterized protein n=1 Tax=Dracunculus medinensis TaxID=318479 RepID=A0A3P7PET8_DRAME|nr:unnamed protein product [Dracunculus medinensis]
MPFEIRPVLAHDIMNEEIPLTEFFVLNVIEKKKLGEILKYLPQMPTWANHLKRIKSGNVLIQPLSFPIDEILRLKLINVFGEIFTFERVLVPSRKPITRQQFTWAKQRWPVEFHPNKNVEAMLNGTFFDKKQQKEIINFFLEAEKVGNGGPGCLMVDLEGKVVAKSNTLQYLGTGFDVYLTEEPCSMCAMALVHFRVSRVFFCRRIPKGALESSWRIQEEKRINHHYQVFRIDEVL